MMTAAMHYSVVLWDQLFDRSGESAAANADRLARETGPGSIILVTTAVPGRATSWWRRCPSSSTGCTRVASPS